MLKIAPQAVKSYGLSLQEKAAGMGNSENLRNWHPEMVMYFFLVVAAVSGYFSLEEQ